MRQVIPYPRSNRIVKIFYNCSTKIMVELGRSLCGLQYKKSSFSKIRVAYNNLHRRIVHVSPRGSASKMFVDYSVSNFEALLRKEHYPYISRLRCSTNMIIRTSLDIKTCYWKVMAR